MRNPAFTKVFSDLKRASANLLVMKYTPLSVIESRNRCAYATTATKTTKTV